MYINEDTHEVQSFRRHNPKEESQKSNTIDTINELRYEYKRWYLKYTDLKTLGRLIIHVSKMLFKASYIETAR